MRPMLFLPLLAALNTGTAQSVFPLPTLITGDGPRPPPLQSPASTGTWTPPAPTNGLKPASMSGAGKQAQLNSAIEFCLYMPPDPTTQNLVDAEATAVAYCFNPFNDTRPFPDGFITSAHFRNTSVYSQISGTFDWRMMNLNPGDCGGEYDNHGAEGLGNPVGAHVDGGDNWMEFVGSCDTPGTGQFCLRSCHGGSSYPYCRNTLDLMGCLWVMPGDYTQPGFTNCQADLDLPVGVYNDSYTFSQGQPVTPTAMTAPASSSCTTVSSPAPSGVTYTWAQLGYASPTSSGPAAVASITGSPGSSSKSLTIPSPTKTGKTSDSRSKAPGRKTLNFAILVAAVFATLLY